MASWLGYRPVFSDSAVEFFATRSRRQQRRLLDRAHELAADPFLEPDYYSDDADGNKVASVVTGDFVFTYWVDHAVKRVMITEIAPAE